MAVVDFEKIFAHDKDMKIFSFQNIYFNGDPRIWYKNLEYLDKFEKLDEIHCCTTGRMELLHLIKSPEKIKKLTIVSEINQNNSFLQRYTSITDLTICIFSGKSFGTVLSNIRSMHLKNIKIKISDTLRMQSLEHLNAGIHLETLTIDSYSYSTISYQIHNLSYIERMNLISVKIFDVNYDPTNIQYKYTHNLSLVDVKNSNFHKIKIKKYCRKIKFISRSCRNVYKCKICSGLYSSINYKNFNSRKCPLCNNEAVNTQKCLICKTINVCENNYAQCETCGIKYTNNNNILKIQPNSKVKCSVKTCNSCSNYYFEDVQRCPFCISNNSAYKCFFCNVYGIIIPNDKYGTLTYKCKLCGISALIYYDMRKFTDEILCV